MNKKQKKMPLQLDHCGCFLPRVGLLAARCVICIALSSCGSCVCCSKTEKLVTWNERMWMKKEQYPRPGSQVLFGGCECSLIIVNLPLCFLSSFMDDGGWFCVVMENQPTRKPKKIQKNERKKFTQGSHIIIHSPQSCSYRCEFLCHCSMVLSCSQWSSFKCKPGLPSWWCRLRGGCNWE